MKFKVLYVETTFDIILIYVWFISLHFVIKTILVIPYLPNSVIYSPWKLK